MFFYGDLSPSTAVLQSQNAKEAALFCCFSLATLLYICKQKCQRKTRVPTTTRNKISEIEKDAHNCSLVPVQIALINPLKCQHGVQKEQTVVI